MPKITIELNGEQHRRYVNAKMDLAEKSLQSLMIHATEQFLAASELSTAQTKASDATAVPAPPGLLAGLDAHQQYLIHNLAEILRQQPQGSTFHLLQNALDLAVKDWQKLKGLQNAAPKAPSTSFKHVRKPTGTGRDH